MPQQTPEVIVSDADDVPLSKAAIKRIVSFVMVGEGNRVTQVSVSFPSSQQMRALNRRTFGKDRATDVIAFPLQHGDLLVGDLYVCLARAGRSADELGVSAREELARLLVHGTLHLVGHDHPEGSGRTESRMWDLQEQYLGQLGKVYR